MPKIPVYQQNVEMAAGSLGPRATSAFEAPGRALAGLGKQVRDTAFKFGMIERDREDKRVKREEYATAYTTANNAIQADTSTNFQDAENNFRDNVRKKIMQDIDNKGYSNRRTDEVKGFVDRLLLEKQFEAKQKAVARGKIKSAAAYDGAIDVGLEELRALSHNSPLFEFKANALKTVIDQNALDGLPSRYNSANLAASISGIKQNSKRTSVQNNIASATNDEQIEAALNSPEFKELKAPEQNTLRSLGKVRSGEIESSLIASYVNTVPIENVGDTNFDTVEDVRQKIEDGRKGKFDDADLTAQWKKLDPEVKNKIEEGWQARLNIAQAQVDHKRRAKDAIEKDANEELYTDLISKIKADVPDPEIIKKINEANFQGVNGEKLREQLIGLAGRRARGEIINDSKPTAHREAQQKIFTGEVTDVTQGFQLTTDTDEMRSLPEYQRNGGLSLLQRQGADFADKDVEAFERYIRAEAKITESDANSAFVKNMKAFDRFTKNYKDKIIGNPNFASLNLNSDSRYYDFTKQMESRYLDAIERGDSPRELLDPRSPKFLIRPNENFTPTHAELMQEITDSLVDTGDLPSLQELAPPPIPAGMSYADYLQTDAYKTYRTGPNYPRYIEMMRRQQQQ